MTEELERLANWLNDRDAEWWPFLFMRPPPEHPITSLRVAALAVLYGAPAGAFADAWIALSGGSSRVHVLLVPLLVTAAFFVAFRVTLAFAWNRRASRMRA
jgi:hypothetical protein